MEYGEKIFNLKKLQTIDTFQVLLKSPFLFQLHLMKNHFFHYFFILSIYTFFVNYFIAFIQTLIICYFYYTSTITLNNFFVVLLFFIYFLDYFYIDIFYI